MTSSTLIISFKNPMSTYSHIKGWGLNIRILEEHNSIHNNTETQHNLNTIVEKSPVWVWEELSLKPSLPEGSQNAGHLPSLICFQNKKGQWKQCL